jgi:hypothetical protein
MTHDSRNVFEERLRSISNLQVIRVNKSDIIGRISTKMRKQIFIETHENLTLTTWWIHQSYRNPFRFSTVVISIQQKLYKSDTEP